MHAAAAAAPLSEVRRRLAAYALTLSLASAGCLCLALSLLSGELRPSPGSALVLEDDAGLCGCALALVDAKEAAAKCQVIRRSFSCPYAKVEPAGVHHSASVHQRAVSPSVLEEFPSLVTMQLLPRVTDWSPAKRMMSQLLSSIRTSGRLRSSKLGGVGPVGLRLRRKQPAFWLHVDSFPFLPPAGSKGAFCELRRRDQRMVDFYTKLGCFNHVDMGEDIVVMGTSL